MSKISIKNLDLYYGDFKALKNINLEIEENKITAFIGPSGCGKSTLLDIIAGLMPSSAGQVFFLGEPVIKPRKEIGYMLQRDQLFEWRSILRNTLLGPEIQHSSHKDKRKARKTASEMLTRYDLGGFLGAKPSELSGGMRQRVGIAMAMSFHPKLLLADEPTSALDVTTQATIVKEMMEVRKNMNIAIIIVTHNMGVAAYMADNIMVMKNGEVVEYGKAEEVIYHPKTDYVKMLLAAVPSLGGKTTA